MLKLNFLYTTTLLCAGLLLCGFQWPWENQPETAAQAPGPKPSNPSPASGQPSQIKPQPVKAAPLKPAAVQSQRPLPAQQTKSVRTEKIQPMPPVPAKPRPMQTSAAAALKPQPERTSAVKPAPAQPSAAAPAAPALPKPSLSGESVQLRQKLNDIIRVNESVNKLNRAKIAQVQVIVDQARVHQRLLNELSVPQDVTTVIKTSDADQVLMQEKLRAIRDESQKSRAFNGSQGNKKQ